MIAIDAQRKSINDRIISDLMARPGVQRVEIARDGAVTCYGDMPRGDGGPVMWWKFAGWRDDLARTLQNTSDYWGCPVGATIDDYRAQDAQFHGGAPAHVWTDDAEHIYCDGVPVAD